MNTSSARTNIPRIIGLVLLYLLYFLLFSELIARFVLGNERIFSTLRTNNDNWWRLQWVKNYKTERPFELSHDIFDPLLGWRTKANIVDGKTGDAKLTTNVKGIRSLKDYAYDKPAGMTRILLLGDSFTFGENVSDEEVYANLLEKALNNTEVINMAVHGYGTDQMLLSLQHEGVKYHPDIVILGFIGQDMERNLLSFRDFAKPKYELVNGKLLLTHVPIPPPTTWIHNEFYRLKLVDLYEMILSKMKWSNDEAKRASERITIALLDEMGKTIRGIGAIPVFLYLPTPLELASPSPENSSQEEFLLSYCRKKEILCTSMTAVFTQAREQGSTLKPYGHWDAYGHSLVVDVLMKYLKGQNLIR